MGISGSPPLLKVLLMLISLPAKAEPDEFTLCEPLKAVQGQHACGICMEDLPGASFVWPGGCDHAYCKDCVRQLCSLHVAEGGLENLRCPQPDCKQPFDRQVQLSRHLPIDRCTSG